MNDDIPVARGITEDDTVYGVSLKQSKCLRGEHEADDKSGYLPIQFGVIAKVCKHCQGLFVPRGPK